MCGSVLTQYSCGLALSLDQVQMVMLGREVHSMTLVQITGLERLNSLVNDNEFLVKCIVYLSCG